MAKRGKPSFSKRGLVGLRRITSKVSGQRVFVYQGEEFETMRKLRNKYPLDR